MPNILCIWSRNYQHVIYNYNFSFIILALDYQESVVSNLLIKQI